jgi:hypothetical protein
MNATNLRKLFSPTAIGTFHFAVLRSVGSSYSFTLRTAR